MCCEKCTREAGCSHFIANDVSTSPFPALLDPDMRLGPAMLKAKDVMCTVFVMCKQSFGFWIKHTVQHIMLYLRMRSDLEDAIRS
jgi:hypothetical protein